MWDLSVQRNIYLSIGSLFGTLWLLALRENDKNGFAQIYKQLIIITSYVSRDMTNDFFFKHEWLKKHT